MAREYSKKDYGMLIERIREEQMKNPSRANKLAYQELYKDNKINSKGLPKFFNNIGGVFLIVLLVFMFFGDYNRMIGIAGVAFFSALYLVLSNPEPNSIVFIYSHGLTGYAMMNWEMIANILKSPLLSDGANNIFVLLIVALILLVGGILYGTVYCLSDDLQSNPVNRSIPVLLAGTSTIIIHLTYIFLI